MTALTADELLLVRQWREQQFRRRFLRLSLVLALTAGLYGWLSQWVFLAFNISESIAGHVFVVFVHRPAVKGGLVMFNADPELVKRVGAAHWTKYVCGIAGDTIAHRGRQLLVNGVACGEALTRSALFRDDLEMTPDGVIPPGYVYVCGTHPRSFDSRYKLVGLIDEKTFVGRAYRLL